MRLSSQKSTGKTVRLLVDRSVNSLDVSRIRGIHGVDRFEREVAVRPCKTRFLGHRGFHAVFLVRQDRFPRVVAAASASNTDRMNEVIIVRRVLLTRKPYGMMWALVKLIVEIVNQHYTFPLSEPMNAAKSPV